ncbi:hypothetical protein G6F68_010291 [Rhizopus microsporus]|nr:hypothetical protein G6F68_010291 [Rhizopus microsporus]
MFHLIFAPHARSAAGRARRYDLQCPRQSAVLSGFVRQVGDLKQSAPNRYRQRRCDVDGRSKRWLFAVASIELFEPCPADGLVIAAGRATEGRCPIKIDQTMIGNRPELPRALDAGAIDSSDLQECAVRARHSLDAGYVELVGEVPVLTQIRSRRCPFGASAEMGVDTINRSVALSGEGSCHAACGLHESVNGASLDREAGRSILRKSGMMRLPPIRPTRSPHEAQCLHVRRPDHPRRYASPDRRQGTADTRGNAGPRTHHRAADRYRRRHGRDPHDVVRQDTGADHRRPAVQTRVQRGRDGAIRRQGQRARWLRHRRCRRWDGGAGAGSSGDGRDRVAGITGRRGELFDQPGTEADP